MLCSPLSNKTRMLSHGKCLLGIGTASNSTTWVMHPVGRPNAPKTLPKDHPLTGMDFTIDPRELATLMREAVKSRIEFDETALSSGNHTLCAGQKAVIHSENFPKRYPKNHRSSWVIEATSTASTISIFCTTFILTKTKPCRGTYLELIGGDLNERFCGKRNGLLQHSTTNVLEINFRTHKKKSPRDGFWCIVSASEVMTTTTGAPESTTATSEASEATTTTAPETQAQTTASPETTEPTTASPETQEPTATSNLIATGPEPSCRPCGTVNRATRLTYDGVTEVNEYPWHVALVYPATNEPFCGGALYNDLFVITTAACAMMVASLRNGAEVLLGSHNLHHPTPTLQRIPVESAAYHPEFNYEDWNHDAGILLLSRRAQLNYWVKPPCLPDPYETYDNVEAVLTGYSGNITATPYEVGRRILSRQQCTQMFGTYATPDKVCAMNPEGGYDMHYIGMGSPLAMEEEDGRWVLIGLSSLEPMVLFTSLAHLEKLTTDGTNGLCDGNTEQSTTSTQRTTTTPAPTTAGTGSPTVDCKCGRINSVNRIVGGVETGVHEYPWQVAITGASSNVPFCGGSIIADQWILTAAHCVSDARPRNIKVVIGEHNWSNQTETYVTERRDVGRIVVHFGYNSTNLDNDVALLKLTTPIAFSPDNKVAPVCMPIAGEWYREVIATVTGWGVLSQGGSQPYVLHEVDVSTMPNFKCQTFYGDAPITRNMICAGVEEGGQDSCQNDSGGPMVTAGDEAETHVVQIGVVSWGNGCAQPQYPGVYARVTRYLRWIRRVTSGSLVCPVA
ncbi:transmembrane protease serine 9-like isoform X3 [Macrobrachium nipponense]|uniref:transmembrane protease serine 9-like isoform X3 n=1 Tax=Macrobrachium nipponense TaxID=159736 RepID=UPI0030C7D101